MPSTPSSASGNPEGSRGSSPCALPSPSTRRRYSLCRLARAFKSRRAMKTTVPVVQGAAKALRFFDHIAPWYDRINARIYKRRWLERVYRPEEYRQFMEGAGLRLLRFERLNWAACLVIAERPRS